MTKPYCRERLLQYASRRSWYRQVDMKKRRKIWDSDTAWPCKKINYSQRQLFVVLRLQDLPATVITARTDMVTHVRFTRSWFHRQLGRSQKIMRPMHTTL